MSSNVHCFAITGGPCAGKTTGLPILAKLFESIGCRVATLCETSTLFWQCGMPFPFQDGDVHHMSVWESEKLKSQLRLEDAFRTILECETAKKRCVLLCDRGALDPKAYVENDAAWVKTLESISCHDEQELVRRYDAAVHLTTTAADATEHYEKTGSRTEDVEKAKDVDDRIVRAWNVHPSRVVVGNIGVDVAGKMKQAFRHITAFLGYCIPPIDEIMYYPVSIATDIPSFPGTHNVTFHTVILQATSSAQDYVALSWRASSPTRCVLSVTTQSTQSGNESQHELVVHGREADDMRQVIHPECQEIVRKQVRWTEGAHYVIFESLEVRGVCVGKGVYIVGGGTSGRPHHHHEVLLKVVRQQLGETIQTDKVSSSVCSPNLFHVATGASSSKL